MLMLTDCNTDKRKQILRLSLLLILCSAQGLLAAEKAHFKPLHKMGDALVLGARQYASDAYFYMNPILLKANCLECQDRTSIYFIEGKTGVISTYRHSMGICTVKKEVDQDTVFIAFHGSKYLDDWLTDGNALWVKAPDGLEGKVHRGFLRAADSAWTSLKSILSKSVRDVDRTTFIFTGHSLGGATTTLTAMRFSLNFDTIFINKNLWPNQVKVITFSSPYVGDAQFTALLDRQYGMNFLRFNTNYDMVPNFQHLVPEAKQTKNEIKLLAIEQVGGHLSQSLDSLQQPGLQPKALLYDTAQLGLRISKQDISALPQIGAEVIKILHSIPSADVISVAFFDYKEKLHEVEGIFSGDMSENKPGHTSLFDVKRNPILKKIVAFLGGY